jgi:N-acyl homoserine lactone hydrolase
MRVHVVEVGWIQWPEGWFRSRTWGHVLLSVLRGLGGPADAIPILAYVVEHDDGHIVIDTGSAHALARRIRSTPGIRRTMRVHVEPNDEIGPQMRARGLQPEDVRVVLPTHLHVDHSGGVGHFPNADVLVHRTEWEHRRKSHFGYDWRIQKEEQSWPLSLEPELYDLAPEPYGPFDRSLILTDQGDVIVLPTPGPTAGHVAIAARTSDLTLLFTGDHIMRQSWYAADLSRGMQPVNFIAKLTDDTNRRLERFVERFPTLLLPSHDAEATHNLARREPLRIR